MVTLRLASSELPLWWLFCETLPLLLLINLLVVFSSCRVLGKSSPNKSFPDLRVLEQACLNSWFK